MKTMMMTMKRRMMTMMKKIDSASLLFICAFAALSQIGCSEAEASANERADRASRQYSAAMAELQAGRVDSAIKGFEDVVRMEPGNGNAHFQLAALLEDVKKDYLGAIIHYRIYQMIRPGSDKAAVAIDRTKGCEMQYEAALLEKAGLDNKFATELKALRGEHEQCGKKIAILSDALDNANRKIAALEKTSEMKTKMLERANAIVDDASAPSAPAKKVRPTDSELLDAEEEDGRRITTSEIKTLRAMLEDDERTAKPPQSSAAPGEVANNPFAKKKEEPAKPEIPETYVVEEGDTLMRISAKFYGTNRRWREIREANKAIISSDGRIRAGQRIKLP